MKRKELINLRKLNNMTQNEVAIKAGIKRSYYGLIENGKRNPSLEIAIKISKLYDVNLQQLFPEDIFFGNRCYKVKHKEEG